VTHHSGFLILLSFFLESPLQLPLAIHYLHHNKVLISIDLSHFHFIIYLFHKLAFLNFDRSKNTPATFLLIPLQIQLAGNSSLPSSIHE